MKDTKYFVNIEKKTVVCVITVQDDFLGNVHRFEGKAKCSPEDIFDENIGREIAQNRAFIRMKAHFREYKKDLSKAINDRIARLIKLNRRMLAGIDRNEGEINTAKARIRELGTTK